MFRLPSDRPLFWFWAASPSVIVESVAFPNALVNLANPLALGRSTAAPIPRMVTQGAHYLILPLLRPS